MDAAPLESAPLVSLAGVGKSYGRVRALEGVDVTFRAGEVHVLLGENGAGKSTLAAILAGVQQPDAGAIRIDGNPRRLGSPREAMRHGIGVVFQHPQLVPSLSVVDNIALGEGAHGRAGTRGWWRRPQRARIVEEMRAAERRLGASTLLDPFAPAGALSQGERQRVAIVRALMRDSRLLVLDEPTAMLTPDAAADLGRLMRRLAGQGERRLAVVFITHRLDEALDWGDRITVLRRGRKVGELVPEAKRGAEGPRETARRALLGMMFAGDVVSTAPAAAAPAPAGQVVLKVEGLRLAGSVPPLVDIDLEVRAGEIVGIAGIDGNGQRELAEALAGQRSVDGGAILLDGMSMRGVAPAERFRRGLRYASDDRLGEGSVGALSIALNLLLKRIGEAPFWRRGVARGGAIERHARQVIAAYDVRAPGPRTPAAHLSGGNLQKLIIARELDGVARAIVFAKPTHGLDALSAAACRERIRAAARAGLAVLLVSTDLDEIIALSDRIAVMANGRIVAHLGGGAGAREAAGRAISRAAARAGAAA